MLLCLSSAILSCGPRVKDITIQNERFLVGHPTVKDFFDSTDKYVSTYSSKRKKQFGLAECRVYRDEEQAFLDMVRYVDKGKAFEMYRSKGRTRFTHEQLAFIEKQKRLFQERVEKATGGDTILSGCRIALDPGHTAGTFQEAVHERKFVQHTRGGKTYRFFEAELNLKTALILRKKLERKGATVFLTRDQPGPVTPFSYSAWVKTHMKHDLEKLARAGDITRGEAWYIRYRASDRSRHDFFLREIERPYRTMLINRFGPDLTLSIHYNANWEPVSHTRQKIVSVRHYLEKENMPDSEKLNNIRRAILETHKTRENYSAVFVPGSYTEGDMEKPRSRMHFLRLLLSRDMEYSQELAHVLMQSMENKLRVPAAPSSYAKYVYSIPGVHRGIFARNLRIPRLTNGPVCLVEPFLQNNPSESRWLHREDVTEEGYRVNRRVRDAAQAYYDAIQSWCSNKPQKK